jgi:hypothetical protein
MKNMRVFLLVTVAALSVAGCIGKGKAPAPAPVAPAAVVTRG